MEAFINFMSLGRKIKHWKVIAICLMVYDFVAILFSYFFSLWLRFDFIYTSIPQTYMEPFAALTPVYAVLSIILFWYMRMYRSVWRFAGFHEFLRYIVSSLAASLIYCICITVIFQRMPFAYYIVGSTVQAILISGIRMTYRIYLTIFRPMSEETIEEPAKNIMIIGGGAAGRNTIRELNQTDKLNATPVCIIDDNPNKWGRYIEGVPVTGGRDDIMESVEKYHVDQIYFCIPSAPMDTRRTILNICSETGKEMKSLPGTYQLVKGEVLISRFKPVSVEDLLGRDSVKVNMEEIFHFIRDKVILVTGGGGSIGSELCRQIAGHSPKHLIIFDIYENNAYDIEQELKRLRPELKLTVLIGSVRDSQKVFDIFRTYKPEIVYHAAAHKHVPLMESSPCEAIKNNVMGTYKTALAALQNGCRRFVLISTDKAVNPTNIMGASKRLCEMVIQCMDDISKNGRYDLLRPMQMHEELNQYFNKEELQKLYQENKKDMSKVWRTEFVAVRFGNVLGSNGSVIPLFKKQIAEGGPVTVTHPDIIRYFMTIPEAVGLVLQAGTYANGGEIFVLDMGEPVKIDTLARNLIKLSGFNPDQDIKIVYSGLRPGEKLYEEKLMEEEGLDRTPNKLVFIGKPIPFDSEEFMQQLADLAKAAYKNYDDIIERVTEIVPTFHHMTLG